MIALEEQKTKLPEIVLLPEVPLLKRPPRIRLVKPRSDITDAKIGIKLAKSYLIDLYDWQEDIVCSWLARDVSSVNKKYIHASCGLILPRQNGKTKGVIAARMLIGAVFYGEIIRYSAHRVDTMIEMWNIFVDMFGDTRKSQLEWKYPELHTLIEKMIHTNGHYSIKFKNGGAIYFVARSTGAGRGNSIDVCIYDEAQYLTDTQQSNDLPSISAAPHGNPQVIYVGTPPDFIESTGEAFGALRKQAINGAENISWHEWSVDEVGDVSDRERWYATNPSLGYSLIESAVLNEFYTMSPEKFAQERLAYWSNRETIKAVVDEEWLETTVDGNTEKYSKYCIGIKFAPNFAQFSVSVGLLLQDGDTYCELVQNYENTKNLVPLITWLTERKDKITLIAIDGKSGAVELQERLIKNGFSKKAVQVLNTQEVIVASTMLCTSLEEKTIKHAKGAVIDKSALEASRRKIGTDGFGFGGNSIPLESLAIANWAAKTTKRDTNRKMHIIG